MKHIVRFVILCSFFIVILIMVIRAIEQRSLFFPMAEVLSTPSDHGLDHEEIFFETQDQKMIHAWFVPKEGARFTILLSHGNAGNMSHRIGKVSLLHDLGANVFLFDYRGYGKSKGTPSEKGFYADISAAYQYLIDDQGLRPEEVIVYGESIGSGAAIDLAFRKPVRALIVEAGFTSVQDMARRIFPFIPSVILSNRFDNLAKISQVHCKKLIIHSIDDEIVPFSHGQRLYENAAEPKQLLAIRGGHNTAFWDSMTEYQEGLRSFLDLLWIRELAE